MKKEALSISMTKLIMAVSLIVGIGAIMGMLGYFRTMPKSEVVINNIQQEKPILEKGDIVRLFSQEAQIIETQLIESESGEDRVIVLWMINPEKIEKIDNLYTCPETTRGSYYQGPTRVSLANLEDMRIINTIEIKSPSAIGDEFYIPYQIRDDIGPYFVREEIEKTEGKPTIIKLKDYNEDGKASEFAFFDSSACVSPSMTIVGYSENKDEIIQYKFNLKERTGDDVVLKSGEWLGKIFLPGLSKDGYWEAESNTCGRGGAIEKSEINYNQEKETFEGEIEIISCDSTFFVDWKTYRNEEYGIEMKYPNYLMTREIKNNKNEIGVHFCVTLEWLKENSPNSSFSVDWTKECWGDFVLAMKSNDKKLSLKEYFSESINFLDLRFDIVSINDGMSVYKLSEKQSDEYYEKFGELGTGLEYSYWFAEHQDYIFSIGHGQDGLLDVNKEEMAFQMLSTFKFIEK